MSAGKHSYAGSSTVEGDVSLGTGSKILTQQGGAGIPRSSCRRGIHPIAVLLGRLRAATACLGYYGRKLGQECEQLSTSASCTDKTCSASYFQHKSFSVGEPMQTCFLYVAFKLLCADLLVIAEWLVRNHRNEAGHGQWDVRSNAGKHKCIQGCTSAPCRFAMGNWPCIQEPGPGAPKVTKVHESFFPMYLVKACRSVVERESPPPRNDFKVQSHAKVSDFLAMEGVPESHDRLKQRGLLHEYNPSAGMFTIFVSHQWLGRKHPDPTGEQVSVLRTTLKRLIGDWIPLL